MMYQMLPMKESERKYTFNQSHQIEMQTGLIGYLRADMDSNGKGFFSTWNEFNPTLKTEEFKREFDDVINALRLDNKFEKVLYDRDSLRKYCADHPEIKYNDVRNFYGIRVNSDNYAYGQFFQIELMRSELNKSKTHFKNFGRALFGREVKEAEYVKRDKGLLSSFRKGYEKLSKGFANMSQKASDLADKLRYENIKSSVKKDLDFLQGKSDGHSKSAPLVEHSR